MKFEVRVESGCIVLEPIRLSKPSARIIKETSSGYSVLDVEDAPTLTSERVAVALADLGLPLAGYPASDHWHVFRFQILPFSF
jgi:hypothetical protein